MSQRESVAMAVDQPPQQANFLLGRAQGKPMRRVSVSDNSNNNNNNNSKSVLPKATRASPTRRTARLRNTSTTTSSGSTSGKSHSTYHDEEEEDDALGSDGGSHQRRGMYEEDDNEEDEDEETAIEVDADEEDDNQSNNNSSNNNDVDEDDDDDDGDGDDNVDDDGENVNDDENDDNSPNNDNDNDVNDQEAHQTTANTVAPSRPQQQQQQQQQSQSTQAPLDPAEKEKKILNDLNKQMPMFEGVRTITIRNLGETRVGYFKGDGLERVVTPLGFESVRVFPNINARFVLHVRAGPLYHIEQFDGDDESQPPINVFDGPNYEAVLHAAMKQTPATHYFGLELKVVRRLLQARYVKLTAHHGTPNRRRARVPSRLGAEQPATSDDNHQGNKSGTASPHAKAKGASASSSSASKAKVGGKSSGTASPKQRPSSTSLSTRTATTRPKSITAVVKAVVQGESVAGVILDNPLHKAWQDDYRSLSGRFFVDGDGLRFQIPSLSSTSALLPIMIEHNYPAKLLRRYGADQRSYHYLCFFSNCKKRIRSSIYPDHVRAHVAQQEPLNMALLNAKLIDAPEDLDMDQQAQLMAEVQASAPEFGVNRGHKRAAKLEDSRAIVKRRRQQSPAPISNELLDTLTLRILSQEQQIAAQEEIIEKNELQLHQAVSRQDATEIRCADLTNRLGAMERVVSHLLREVKPLEDLMRQQQASTLLLFDPPTNENNASDSAKPSATPLK